jgi:hypothetical protein
VRSREGRGRGESGTDVCSSTTEVKLGRSLARRPEEFTPLSSLLLIFVLRESWACAEEEELVSSTVKLQARDHCFEEEASPVGSVRSPSFGFLNFVRVPLCAPP